MQSDPDLKRIMSWQIGIPGLRFLLLILLSSVCLGTSNPDLKRSLFVADDLQNSPSQDCCQQSSHYRKEDLDYCNDFAARIQAQTLGQFLPPDGQDYRQQLPKQSRSTLSSHPRPVIFSSITLPLEPHSGNLRTPVFTPTMTFPSSSHHTGVKGPVGSPPSIASSEPPLKKPIIAVAAPPRARLQRSSSVGIPPMSQGPLSSPTNFPLESPSVTSRTVFAPSMMFPSHANHPGRKGHASPPSIASAEPPWNRPITPVTTPTRNRSWWHVPVVTAPQNQGPVSSIFAPPSEPHKGSIRGPLSAPSMTFPSPPYHAGHVASTPSINVSEPPQKRLEMPVAVPPHRRRWRHTPVAIPPMSQGPVSSPPITFPPAPPIGNSRSPVFSPSIVLLTPPHGGGVKGPVASPPRINLPEPPEKRPEMPVAVPPQRRSQRHMPVAIPPVSQGPVSSIFTPPSDPYHRSSRSPVLAPSMIFPFPPHHAGLRGHVASPPSIYVSEPPQKRLEMPVAVSPHRRSWRHTPVAIPPTSQGSLSSPPIILPPAPPRGNSRSPVFSPPIVLPTPLHRGGVKGPVASPPSIDVSEPPQKRLEMPVAVPPQRRSRRHTSVAIPPMSQGPVSSIFTPPSEPYRGSSRSPVLAPSMIFPSPPHQAGHVASTPSINVSEPPRKRLEMPMAVPPHRRSQTHTPVGIPLMSQGSVSSPPIALPPAPPIGISRNPVFSPSIIHPIPSHPGGGKGPVASPPSINVSEPPQKRPEMPVAVPPQRRSQRHMPVASPPMSDGSVSSPPFTHPPALPIGNLKGPVFAPSNILSTPAHRGGPVASPPSINVSEPPQKRLPVAVPTHGRSHRHTPVATPPMSLGSISSPITLPPAPSIGNSKSPVFAPSIVLPTPPHRGGVKGSVSSPSIALPPESPSRNSKTPAFAPSIIFPSPPNHQGPLASPNIAPSEPPQRQSRTPVAAPPMLFPSPPPTQDCSTVSCADPLTYSPPGSPCGCVSPMKVELGLGVALYAFFPLVPELAVEIAAGTYLKPSQVRIMGANSESQDQDKTLVIIDLVPLGQIFDNTTAFLIYNKFWQKKVIINETLFGDYRVVYVRYPGLPLSPPSAFSNPTRNANPFGRSDGPSIVEPLGANIRKRNDKMGSGTIAVVALSSAIAAVICLGAVWIVLLKCSNQSRLPSIVEPTLVSSVTKRSGGGSILSGSLASSTSMSLVSSMATYTGSAKTFMLAELEKATDRFSPQNILGEGGFGRVYRGVLEDGMKVAVKVLTRDDQHGGREFIAEVEMLSRLHHRNLVKLIGICTEEHNRCLVYELIPNGSVESHLHGVDKETAPLDWDARMKIALGAARGLAYLHEDSSPRVIHRDFKASNILLEDDFTPKVSDFGLAKAASEEGSGHISTRVMGTFGYVAPEYAMTGHLLVKSDVYSYGVVLLELLSGRKPVDMSQPPGQENLVTWARSLLTSKEGLEILKDPALGGNVPFDNMARVAAIASMCVQPEVSHRPFMGEVVQALKLVYNDSDTSNGGGSGSCSQLGGSSAHDNEVKDVSGQMWCSSTQYVPDSTSFVTIDYDSGPLQTQGLQAERPLSASALLPTSGRLVRQLSGSFRRHNSSGPLRTHRSKALWQREGSISEHHMSRHLGTGFDGDIHELWP